MTTVITPVLSQSIDHGVLIDLTLTKILKTTATSGTGSVVTITFATQPAVPFAVGDKITVKNILPATYNGTFDVVSSTTTTVTYAHTATGSQTQAGNIGITYFISNCYTPVSYDGNTYQALAGFLQISEIQNNISNANDEIQVGLSAIPSIYIASVLDTQIKGGEINIYRAFFDYDTQLILASGVFKRFAGIISNYAVQEDVDFAGYSPEVTHTITIIASSIMGVLENKVSGRRTNKEDYQIVYDELGNSASDPSMDRVDALFNSSFDFGKPYKGGAASTVNGGNPGSTGGGGASDSSDNQTSGERF
jgi:uncharacterized membrane protein YgcG